MCAARKKTVTTSASAVLDLHDEFGEALQAELSAWPGVVTRRMMGTLSFFRGKNMLGCYVHRTLFKKAPPQWAPGVGEPPFVWIRLRPAEKEKALRRPHVRESISNPMKTWVEVPLFSRAALEEAVRWFGRAYEQPLAATRKTSRKPRKARKTSNR